MSLLYECINTVLAGNFFNKNSKLLFSNLKFNLKKNIHCYSYKSLGVNIIRSTESQRSHTSVLAKAAHSHRRLGSEPQVSRPTGHVEDTRDESNGRARPQRPRHVVSGRQGRVDTTASARLALRHGHEKNAHGNRSQADGAHAKSRRLALSRSTARQMRVVVLAQ